MTDWDNLDKEMGGNFKNYAEEGKYEVKCNSVEFKEVGTNGSIIMKFGFEEDDNKYPTADHWCSFKNENFRKYHNRNLMMVLGATKDAAQKAVDMCESKGDKGNIVKAYETTFKKLLSKKPTVKIEVYPDGKYSKSEFLDKSVSMPHDSEKKQTGIVNDTVPIDGPIAGAEEIDLSEADLPF